MTTKCLEITSCALKNTMQITAIAITLVILSGCANGYKDFYIPNNTENLSELELLKTGEQPTLYETANPDREIDILLSKNFRAIGHSSFNGKMHSRSQLLDQATRIRATHVIYSTKFATSQITSTPLILPNGIGGFSSTALIGQQMRHDQIAVFFAKNKTKLRFGIVIDNLSPEGRKTLGTNKGALVHVVLEDTPAFYANVFKNDVITHLNRKEILNAEHLGETLSAIPQEIETISLIILRDGKTIDATLDLKK